MAAALDLARRVAQSWPARRTAASSAPRAGRAA